MPSGAKKRKAQKKKQQQSHSHGENVNHQDNKVSDVADVSSPTSQDNRSSTTEVKEAAIEEQQRNVSNLPSGDGSRIQKDIVLEEGGDQVQRNFKIDNELDKKDRGIEHDEGGSKSYNGGSSGSSSSSRSNSSSDDERDRIRNSQVGMDIPSVVDYVKVTDSLSGGAAEAIHSAPIREFGYSVVENVPVADLEKISDLGEQVEADVSYPAVIESPIKEYGEKKLVSVEGKVGTPVSFINAASNREEEPIVSVENTATDPNECVTQKNDDRLPVTDYASRATTDNGADHKTNSEVTEPLLVPSPLPVQKTSWKGCCGLFEVFSGSGA